MACEICDNAPVLCRHRLEAIKDRHEKATPRWTASDYGKKVIGFEIKELMSFTTGESQPARCFTWGKGVDEQDVADMAFAIWAREDIPLLLAEVWRLREELGYIALGATNDPKSTANLALGFPADH